MKHLKHILIIGTFLITLLILQSCIKKEYIEVPVEVEKVKKEYITKIDSVYFRDSVNTFIFQKGDTIIQTNTKYIIREKFSVDTVHKIDSIPKIIKVTEIKEVNKLHGWQKLLMLLGGVGILGFIIFILNKFKIWKLK